DELFGDAEGLGITLLAQDCQERFGIYNPAGLKWSNSEIRDHGRVIAQRAKDIAIDPQTRAASCESWRRIQPVELGAWVATERPKMTAGRLAAGAPFDWLRTTIEI